MSDMERELSGFRFFCVFAAQNGLNYFYFHVTLKVE